MRTMSPLVKLFMATSIATIFVCIVVLLISCGPATGATGVRVEIVNAVDGTVCYVATQDGKAVGLSCRN